MEIKIIKNRLEYETALLHLAKLMDENPTPGSKKENDLELLLLVIHDYEQRVCAPIIPDPVDAIKFRMDQMKYTRKDLIPFLGSMSKVSEVLSRRRGLSLTMIRKLHKGLGIPLASLLTSPPSKKRTARTKKKIKVPKSRKRSFIKGTRT